MRIFPAHPIVASHPKHLTSAWAQHIVNQQIPGVKVSKTKLISTDIGTTTRVRLSVDHNGPESLANQWFVKLPSLSWRARAITALPQLLHTEVRFYNELAQLTPVKKPTVLSAKSFFARGSTLVLNDITEHSAIPGSPSDEITAAQAMLVVEQIALLHAKFWDKAHNNPEYKWLAGPIRRLEDHLGTALAVPLMKRGLKKSGDIVPNLLHNPAIHYARHRRKAMHLLSQGTQTIVHHDCHPGNLFWHQSQPGLLDWQMVRIGEGISDIAYFLATSLNPKTRHSHEKQLIQHYIDCLKKHHIPEVDSEKIYQRYRAHLIYPFEAMLITLAVGGMMDLEANKILIQRAAAAVNDNHAFSAISL